MKLFILLVIAALYSLPASGIIITKNLIRANKSIMNNHPEYCAHHRSELPPATAQARTHWVDFGKLKINTKKRTISLTPSVAETYCTYGRTVTAVLSDYREILAGKTVPRVFQIALYYVNGAYKRKLKLIRGKSHFSYYIDESLVMNPKKKKFKKLVYDISSIMADLREGSQAHIAIDYSIASPQMPLTKFKGFDLDDEKMIPDYKKKIETVEGIIPVAAVSDRAIYHYFSYDPDKKFFNLAKKYLKRKMKRKLQIDLKPGPRYAFTIQKYPKGFRIVNDHWLNKDIILAPHIATEKDNAKARRRR